MKTVIIMRGPSGSGKSTLAKKIVMEYKENEAIIVSADNFFVVENPEYAGGVLYQHDPSKIGEAHAECLHSFLRAIEADTQCIIVDNTNIHQWEYRNYEILARMHGYEVEIVEVRPTSIEDIKTCIGRNTHCVPDTTIMKMCVDFEYDDRATVYDIRGL